jgi:hypothetical protein
MALEKRKLKYFSLNGWGLTIIDGLDTMILMGLDAEVDDAMDFIEKLDFTKHKVRLYHFCHPFLKPY